MTETDPGAARPNAGAVGVHRQDVSKPVTDPESLNAVRQARHGPEPVAAARDTEIRGRGEEHKGHDEIAEIRQEIERTRDDLGDTIEALAAKADVKARAQERMHATTAAARARVAGLTGRVREVTPQPLRGAAGRVGEQAKRRPGLIAAAGAAGTALLVARRITRGRGRTTRPGMYGMLQKSGMSGKVGMPAKRGTGGARMGRGMPGGSGRMGKPSGGLRMFGARSRSGGVGPLGGKGAFGGKATFGRRTMFGRKSVFGGTRRRGVFGRKSVFGRAGMLGGIFGGRRMFPQPRRPLMRGFGHR